MALLYATVAIIFIVSMKQPTQVLWILIFLNTNDTYKYAASHSSAETVPHIAIYTCIMLLGFLLIRRGKGGVSNKRHGKTTFIEIKWKLKRKRLGTKGYFDLGCHLPMHQVFPWAPQIPVFSYTNAKIHASFENKLIVIL